MSQVRYQITLSLDGNHSVSVSGDDPASVKDGLAWARGIYLKLKERSESNGSAAASAPEPASAAAATSPTPPACPLHLKPTTLVTGKRGPFWSCHEKGADGSWCSYKASFNG